ncbi:MAG: hypothetical protein J0H29_07065 [Sphingobacteriales bacterium]|nr:hypothetical protein [Sphingobacteriales bacterium]OJY81678.1 MAG: hypothetical protein BGP14_02540 [Sphingobacteriales bacterium 44-15]
MIMIIVRAVLIFTSNRISRLFLPGSAAGGIEKNAKHIFSKDKKLQRSGYPARWRDRLGGKSNELRGCT